MELESGLTVEAVVGSESNAKPDPSASLAGIRLSRAKQDERDSFIAPEIEVLSGWTDEDHWRFKLHTNAGVMFYETYHPLALRAGFGVGTEIRRRKVHPGAWGRAGIGYHVDPRFSLWA